MIANVSPSSETFEDTFNTLKYADRAKKIKIDLKKNVLNVDFHVAQYAKIVEDLRRVITCLFPRDVNPDAGGSGTFYRIRNYLFRIRIQAKVKKKNT